MGVPVAVPLQLLLLLLQVALAVLLFLLSGSLSLLFGVKFVGRAILAHLFEVVVGPFPLSLVITALVLNALTLERVLEILCFEVTLKLPEFSLDLVFPILANHLDGAETFLCLSQFVLLLLLRAALLGRVNALIYTSAVPLSNLEVLMAALGACRCATAIHHDETCWVH